MGGDAGGSAWANLWASAWAIALATAGLGLSSSSALAHDSWFAPAPAVGATAGQILLGTGNRYPLLDSPIGSEFLVQQGCQKADGQTDRLTAVSDQGTALRLQPPAGARSCWAQTRAFDLLLPPDKISVYLNEVKPTAAIRAAWSDMQARGLPWRERYVKHARIELPGDGAAPRPSPMGMDMLLAGERHPLHTGDTVSVQVLRDGQPLPEFAVEWRHDSAPIGLWSRTDAQGRVSLRLPLAGQWLLRGVDLRLSDTQPDQFDSRFITLALTVTAP